MAGNKKRNAVVAKVTADFGGWDELFAYIAEGGTAQQAAERLGVGRESLMYTMRKVVPDWRERLDAAREARADAYAEEAVEIADAPVETTAEVQHARLRVDTRKWLASIDNPGRYARSAQDVHVSVNVGMLHLDALRKHATAPPLLGGPDGEAGEGEV